jgi:hypothetical protein
MGSLIDSSKSNDPPADSKSESDDVQGCRMKMKGYTVVLKAPLPRTSVYCKRAECVSAGAGRGIRGGIEQRRGGEGREGPRDQEKALPARSGRWDRFFLYISWRLVKIFGDSSYKEKNSLHVLKIL